MFEEKQTIFDILKKYNIYPKYFLGQNFLIDPNLCRKIVDLANIDENSHVLEIGPAIGNLTKFIIKKNPKKITLIEIDKQFIPILNQISFPKIDLIQKDILKIDLNSVFYDLTDNNIIISNLPYYIASKILMNILLLNLSVKSILMVQKELGKRILSDKDKKSYSKISVIFQLLYNAKKIYKIPSTSFYPKPEIESWILYCTSKNYHIDKILLHNLLKITKYAFSYRRKFLISVLSKLIPNLKDIFYQMQIDKTARAENLSPAQYLTLAKYFSDSENSIL